MKRKKGIIILLIIVIVAAAVLSVIVFTGGKDTPVVGNGSDSGVSTPVVSAPVDEPTESAASPEPSCEAQVSDEPVISEPVAEPSDPVEEQPPVESPAPEPAPEPSEEPSPEPSIEPDPEPEPAPSEDLVEIKDTKTEEGEEAVDPSDKTINEDEPYDGQISEDGRYEYWAGFGWVEISDDPDVGGGQFHEGMYVSGEQCPNAEW